MLTKERQSSCTLRAQTGALAANAQARPERRRLRALRRFLEAFRQVRQLEAALSTWPLALFRALKLLAALPLHAEQQALTALPAIQRYLIAPDLPASREYLHFRGYLSSAFSMRQRIDCLKSHFLHESRRRLSAHLEHIYLDGGSLSLWRDAPVGHTLEITLSHPADYRLEGELSLRLLLHDELIATLSFTYIETATVGLPGYGLCPFVACLQASANAAARARFNRHLPDHIPRLLLRAAATGLCEADLLPGMVGIPGAHQISFRTDKAAIFSNAYDALWSETSDHRSALGFWVPLPLPLPEITALPSRRRVRARKRRELWEQIASAARDALVAQSIPPHPQASGQGGEAAAPTRLPVYTG